MSIRITAEWTKIFETAATDPLYSNKLADYYELGAA